MQIKAVNISDVKYVEHQGETVSTGIFKRSVSTPVQVGVNGIEGDVQANLEHHGGVHKAVYGFSLGHYQHWQNVLEAGELQPGAFGENLSVSNLDESEVFIGDQFQIGDCVLEVSQPRVPCFKLGIALNNPRAPGLFTKSFNTGVYFRVAREGSIEAGQSMQHIGRVDHSVSIQQLFQAYFDRSFGNASEVFDKAQQLSTLAPEWQEKVSERIAGTR